MIVIIYIDADGGESRLSVVSLWISSNRWRGGGISNPAFPISDDLDFSVSRDASFEGCGPLVNKFKLHKSGGEQGTYGIRIPDFPNSEDLFLIKRRDGAAGASGLALNNVRLFNFFKDGGGGIISILFDIIENFFLSY